VCVCVCVCVCVQEACQVDPAHGKRRDHGITAPAPEASDIHARPVHPVCFNLHEPHPPYPFSVVIRLAIAALLLKSSFGSARAETGRLVSLCTSPSCLHKRFRRFLHSVFRQTSRTAFCMSSLCVLASAGMFIAEWSIAGDSGQKALPCQRQMNLDCILDGQHIRLG
jgi:hypothetical protein